MDLQGLVVLNPRPLAQADALSEALRAAGARVLALPLLDITPLPLSATSRAALMDLDRFDGVIVVSANAARFAVEVIRDCWPQWPVGVKLLAVGEATAQALDGLDAAVITPATETSEGLLALPALQAVTGQRWLLLRGEDGRELLPDTLRARGAEVTVLPLYRRGLPAEAATQWAACAQRPDAVLLSSAMIWSHWQQVAGQQATAPLLVTVSARLQAQVQATGAPRVLDAGGASPAHWLDALHRWRCGTPHGIQ